MAKISACSSNPYQTQTLPPDLWSPWSVHGAEAINDLGESEPKSERMIFKFKSNTLRFTAIEILYCVTPVFILQSSLRHLCFRIFNIVFCSGENGKESCRMDHNSIMT